MKNEIRFTLESKQRPKLAQEIGNILGIAPYYERVPSCAYDIAGYRLDKEGVLHIPEGAEEETIEDLVSRRCGSNRRSDSAAGEADNSNSKRKPYGYGIGKFAEDHSK